MDDEKTKRKNRQYNEKALKSAIENVLQSNMTVYRAAKEFNIPWSTLKRNVQRVQQERDKGIAATSMKKIGRPFTLPLEKELNLVSYVIQMQEVGFGLTVTKIRQYAYMLAQAEGLEKSFSEKKQIAGRNWWTSFKERYGLSLRQPENLSAGRAMCTNTAVLDDFYEKLEKTLNDHGLTNCPEKIWNCDETGLMYVNKPEKIVTKIGKKYIYNRTYAEKGTTTTVLACVNAAGCFIPPLVIFKGVRNYAELQIGCLPNALTRVSPKGWINADLFLEWLKFFDKNIPPARPVFLIMDSHASHITPEVLEYAKCQQIVLFTMPAHTSHILQPLDVGVFRPLKVAWRAELEKYKSINPNLTPTRYDFHKLLSPAYEKSFTPANIRAGFKKTGIFPTNKAVINPELTAPSQVTHKPAPFDIIQEIVVPEDLEQIIPQSQIQVDIDPLDGSLETVPKTNDIECIASSSNSDIATNNLENTGNCSTWNTSYYNFIKTTGDPQTKALVDLPGVKQKSDVKITDILILPKIFPKAKPNTRQKRSVPKAQCLTPVMIASGKDALKLNLAETKKRNYSEISTSDIETSKVPVGDTTAKIVEQLNYKGKSLKKPRQEKINTDDDWECHSCSGLYSKDVTCKNGADWITCSFCMKPYQLHCQSQEIDKNQDIFMCDLCSVAYSSD